VKSLPLRQRERAAASVAVLIRSPLWRVAGLRPAQTARRAARAALAACEPAARADVTVALSDNTELRALNHMWRGKDRPTNVLAFPAGSVPVGRRPPLGDVILAFETVAQEAEAADLALSHHLSHLVVHGVLHLLGYDHEKPAEARRMEDLEVRVLAGLGIADPYAALPPLRRLGKR
jgi:probable rRNA maturation factor